MKSAETALVCGLKVSVGSSVRRIFERGAENLRLMKTNQKENFPAQNQVRFAAQN